MTWKKTDGYGHYDFSYDQANRLTGAVHDVIDAIGGLPDGRYILSNVSYDKNGNIFSLERQGKISSTTFGDMDELSYTYSVNRLMKVDDSGLSSSLTDVEQFVDANTSGDDYDYDHNGNLTEDLNKGISFRPANSQGTSAINSCSNSWPPLVWKEKALFAYIGKYAQPLHIIVFIVG
ncbi:MAG: hypothetical protein AAF587_32985 [Bacteroidota bacterium]